VTPAQQRQALKLLSDAAHALKDEFDSNGADDTAAHPILVRHKRVMDRAFRFLATAKPAPGPSKRVIDGIISATSAVLAGAMIDEGGDCEDDEANIQAADSWARAQRNGGDK